MASAMGRVAPDLRARLLLALLALTAWRLATAWHRELELYADEAQYWSWSLDPDWGYYSKPPMVAWLIRLGTALFGDGELGVRAATFLIWPLTAWALFLLARRLFRGEAHAERSAFWAALLFATLPMTSLGSWLITSDGPLLLFWTLSLYFLAGALRDDRWRDWLLAGAAAGLGMMSKYSMVFLLPALAVHIALSPQRHGLLRSPKPYAAAGLALLMVAPNIAWNAAHQFVSYRHTAEISQLDGAWLHPDAFLEFLAAQFGVFGPLTALGLLLLALRPRALLADERLRFLAAFSLVPLAAFLALSLLSRAFANWAAFAYVAGAALVAVGWVMRDRRGWLVAALAFNLALGAALYHYHDMARALGIELTGRTDPYARVAGYRALGEETRRLLAAHPGARLLGDDRKTFAALLYYARPLSREAAYLNPGGVIDDHYALTADVRRRPEGEFILVSRDATREQLSAWFAEVRPLAALHIPIHRDRALDYQAWWARDFLGY
ncbi:MAG: glycosyltransferase family 39 protein [Thiobacillaceae bacterium]|nr:glycosyltransferase family 39 protein [Thiobacillaceae bacterium]